MSLTKGNFAVCSTSNGTFIEFPIKSLSFSYDSLANTGAGRNDKGVMVIDHWLQSKLRKWSITLPPMASNDITTLMNIVQGKVYYIKIFDPSTDSILTTPLLVYTSLSSSDLYSGVLTIHDISDTVQVGIVEGFKFNAIEMGTA